MLCPTITGNHHQFNLGCSTVSKQLPFTFFGTLWPTIPVYIICGCLRLTVNFSETTKLSDIVFLGQGTFDEFPTTLVISINNLLSIRVSFMNRSKVMIMAKWITYLWRTCRTAVIWLATNEFILESGHKSTNLMRNQAKWMIWWVSLILGWRRWLTGSSLWSWSLST